MTGFQEAMEVILLLLCDISFKVVQLNQRRDSNYN